MEWPFHVLDTTCRNNLWLSDNLDIPRVRNHLNFNDLLSFGCCLLARSTLLISSTKHLKYPLDYHLHFSHPSTTRFTYKRQHIPTHREKWPLQRAILDTHLILLCWIDHLMNSTWCMNLNYSLSPILPNSSYLQLNKFQLVLVASNCFQIILTDYNSLLLLVTAEINWFHVVSICFSCCF